jgi:hypothetical protein
MLSDVVKMTCKIMTLCDVLRVQYVQCRDVAGQMRVPQLVIPISKMRVDFKLKRLKLALHIRRI